VDKVLIVVVDQKFLNILNEGLQKYIGQFEVVTASDGEAALEVLKKNRISVLVTDLVIPGGDGLELLGHMRKSLLHVPCIVMTESECSEINNEINRDGIFRFIEKPFDINELAALIFEGLDRLDEGLFWREYHK